MDSFCFFNVEIFIENSLFFVSGNLFIVFFHPPFLFREIVDFHEKKKMSVSLSHRWTLFYHDPNSTDWEIDSYVKLCSIDTVEHFWQMTSLLTPCIFRNGMLFLMRGDISPRWEDEESRHGGYWSFRIPFSNASDCWTEFSGRQVCEVLVNETLDINGLSISPKKNFSIIKVWNKDATKEKRISFNLPSIECVIQSKISYTRSADKQF